MRVGVDFHAGEILIDESDEPGKTSFAIYYLVDCPELTSFVLAFVRAARFAVIVALLAIEITTEPKLLPLASVSLLSFLHVLVNLADWYQKVQLERQDNSRQ